MYLLRTGAWTGAAGTGASGVEGFPVGVSSESTVGSIGCGLSGGVGVEGQRWSSNSSCLRELIIRI